MSAKKQSDLHQSKHNSVHVHCSFIKNAQEKPQQKIRRKNKQEHNIIKFKVVF